MKFAWQVVRLMPVLQEDACSMPPPLPDNVDPRQVFEQLCHDPWHDADMASVIHYLRGSSHLFIPPEWREVLPKRI